MTSSSAGPDRVAIGPATTRLPIVGVVREAVGLAARHWRALLAALIGPAAVLAALDVALRRAGGDPRWALALWVPDCLVYALYAVSCHRIVLLGADSLPNRWGVYWTARELRFVGWSVAIALLAFLAALPFLLILTLLSTTTPLALVDAAPWLAWGIVYSPVAYVAARASLALPEVAVDGRPGFEQSWALSRGNGWRLTIALSIPGLLLYGLGELAGSVLDDPDGTIRSFLASLSLCLLGAVEVIVLSVAYRRSTSSPPGSRSPDRSFC